MKTYTINKGKHRSGLHFSPVAYPQNLKGRFRLPDTNYYKAVNWVDLNKICGLSCNIWPFWDGQTIRPPHHWDSMRIAWRPEGGGTRSIELHAYWYMQGVMQHKLLASDVPGFNWQFQVQRDYSRNKWRVELFKEGDSKVIQEVTTAMDALERPKPCFGYLLYPYFGGTETPYRDFKVKLRMETF